MAEELVRLKVRLLRLLDALSSSDKGIGGLRVVRGPDWSWDDQDGGAGCLGTVELPKGGQTVSVIWDNGHQNTYRTGASGKFDLRVVSNGPAGVKHASVTCDACGEYPVAGIRWKCCECPDYDLCSACYHGDKHYLAHPFARIDETSASSTGVEVGVREGQSTLELKGIFPGAKVQRGEDWKWEEQDGGAGKVGTVVMIINERQSGSKIESKTFKSWAVVSWKASDSSMYTYRIGHKGFVDLKATVLASGGRCYYQHLPVVRHSTDDKDQEVDQSQRGLRVVRGPDWDWQDQDGGEGFVGTVEHFAANQKVQVRWDSGKANVYRIGRNGKFDLRIVDSAPVGVVHENVRCDGCGEGPIQGTRWRGKTCPVCYDLCSACYGANKHDLAHPFYRHDKPSSTGELVPARKGNRALRLRGSYPGATVKRGRDWKWDNQDGGDGKTGVVKNFLPVEEGRHPRTWVAVQWNRGLFFFGRTLHHYRLCHKGFIDIQYVTPAEGGRYYAQHLPILGAATDGAGAQQGDGVGAGAEQPESDFEPIYMSDAKDEEQHYPECYYQGLTAKDAETELKAKGVEPGTYLLRDSETVRGGLVLTIRQANGTVQNHRIERDNGNYIIGKKNSFDSLQQLVQHFSQPGRPVVSQLRFPLIRDKTNDIYEQHNSFDAWEVEKSMLTVSGHLGSGSFGDVYKGTWNGNTVAVKRLKRGAMPEREFIAEAESMKRMHHKNVVKLHAVCLKPPQIVMEFMEFGSLVHYLKSKESTLTMVDLRKLASQVAGGMAYLESKQFVHRDLAARNVLVGSDRVAKVCDFGMTRHLHKSDAVFSVEDKALFPVRWSAPEVIERGHCSLKSDVWSFGILLTEIVTYGDMPYANMKTNDVVMREVVGGYRMPRPYTCPVDLYEMMTKCWQDDPDLRPTFADIKATLARSA